MTAELLQPIADEDVEHARRGPRAHLLLINGVLDPRDGQPLDPTKMSTPLRFPLADSRSGDSYVLSEYQRTFTRFVLPSTLNVAGYVFAQPLVGRSRFSSPRCPPLISM